METRRRTLTILGAAALLAMSLNLLRTLRRPP